MKNNFTYSVWIKPDAICQIPTQSQSANAASGFLNNPCVVHPIHGQNYGLDFLNAGTGLYAGTNGLYLEEHSASWEAVPLIYTGDLTGWHQCTIVYENKIPKLNFKEFFDKIKKFNYLWTIYSINLIKIWFEMIVIWREIGLDEQILKIRIN